MPKGTRTVRKADQDVVDTVRRYLSSLSGYGIHSDRAMLFGSFARGEQREWSDIDLLVIAPEFDAKPTCEMTLALWKAARDIDSRIEPVACGSKEWLYDDDRMIIEIVRQEGLEIAC